MATAEPDIKPEPPMPEPPPVPRKRVRSKPSEDGEPIPPLDEPIQPYLL